MWLHRHGLKYFRLTTYNIIRSVQENKTLEKSTQDMNDLIYTVKNLLKELMSHLKNIDEHIKKEDNVLRVMIKNVYQNQLAPKVANLEQLSNYENTLLEELKRLETNYKNLTETVVSAIEYYDGKEHADLTSTTIRNLSNIGKQLHVIEDISEKMANYLKGVLPKMEKYKEWIQREEKNITWAENNIKSWIHADLS